jgi:hypothetical protein
MQEKPQLTSDTIIKRNETKFLASAIGEEIVMMNIDNGDYIGINNVGGVIWNLIDAPTRVEDVINKTVEQYEVSTEQGKTEISAFLENMLEQEMLIIQN